MALMAEQRKKNEEYISDMIQNHAALVKYVGPLYRAYRIYRLMVPTERTGFDDDGNYTKIKGEWVTYLVDTHWGPGGALEIKEGSVRWSSGGICSDATELDVAEVMICVWTDAYRYLKEESS